MMPELPPGFIQTLHNAFEGEGKSWLESLPALLKEASQRWNLTDVQPVPNLSYNFVAFAHQSPSSLPHLPVGGRNLVLKLGIPHKELKSEIAALKIYDGCGACRLLDSDVEKGMLLLERLEPGHMLAALEDDDRATRIAAEVMKGLWVCSNDFAKRPAEDPRMGEMESGLRKTTEFIRLKDWFDGFKRLRQRFTGGTGPLPKGLVAIAETLSSDLLSENKDETLLHGDFHHFNVLESARGWLAIDPKGVIGPRGYEVGPLLINPNDRFLSGSTPRAQTERRIAILSEMLGMERERIRSWGICHAVLSAWWSIEDNEPDWSEYSICCAEILMST